MKAFTTFMSGACFGVFCLFIGVLSTSPIPRSKIQSSQPFMMDQKEWHCAYTPRQVEINLLEDQIKKIKNGN